MATDSTRLPADELGRIYQTLIRPLLFDATSLDGAQPSLVLLGGQPGSGKSRASARIVKELEGPITPLSGDDLRIFHPDYRGLISADPEQAGPSLAVATRVWVRTAIEEALESGRSLLLEGSFGDPHTTMATAERFRRAGFHVRIVAVASPRVLSVVTSTSRYLRDIKAGAPARFTSLSAHDRGYVGTAQLIDSLDSSSPADRVTIVGRNGRILHDSATDVLDEPESTAKDALVDGRHPRAWGARSTMELLGELKQITTYAMKSGNLTHGIAALLTEAHTLALEEVVPRLNINADSPQAQFIRQAVVDQSNALNRSLDVVTSATPRVSAPPQLGPEL